jgi:hypothetical protein
MFKIIDQERLLELQLLGREGEHRGLPCRVSNLRFSLETDEPILCIASQDARALTVTRTLREAARTYQVVNGLSESPSGSESVTLGSYLSGRCKDLLDDWPRTNQEETLHDLMSAGYRGGNAWVDLARNWLKLELARIASPIQSDANRFFRELKQWIAADEWLWKGDSIQSKRIFLEKLDLVPAPKPASIWPELQRGLARARTAAAVAPERQVSFRPYLEGALEYYWTSIFNGSPLLYDGLGLRSAKRTSLEVRIETEVPKEAASLQTRQTRCEIVEAGDALTWTLLLSYRAQLTPNAEVSRFAAVTTIRFEKRSEQVRLKPQRLRSLMKFHLADAVWSLEQHFQRNCMTVTADGRLHFGSDADLVEWLSTRSGSGDIENRLKSLVRTWRRAGPPQITGIDEASVRRTVANRLAVLSQNETSVAH